jgi:hypothetical protein
MGVQAGYLSEKVLKIRCIDAFVPDMVSDDEFDLIKLDIIQIPFVQTYFATVKPFGASEPELQLFIFVDKKVSPGHGTKDLATQLFVNNLVRLHLSFSWFTCEP